MRRSLRRAGALAAGALAVVGLGGGPAAAVGVARAAGTTTFSIDPVPDGTGRTTWTVPAGGHDRIRVANDSDAPIEVGITVVDAERSGAGIRLGGTHAAAAVHVDGDRIGAGGAAVVSLAPGEHRDVTFTVGRVPDLDATGRATVAIVAALEEATAPGSLREQVAVLAHLTPARGGLPPAVPVILVLLAAGGVAANAFGLTRLRR